MASPNDPGSIVSMNDLISAAAFTNSTILREALIRRSLSNLPNANCPSGFCDCNGGYCPCRGSVGSSFDPSSNIVLPADQLERIRSERIAELQDQLRQLEGG